MRAVDAAHEFIDVTFKLLDIYKEKRSSGDVSETRDIDLQGPFALRINQAGFIYLIEKKPDGTVKHTYAPGSRNGFPAGNLMSIYLEKLYS